MDASQLTSREWLSVVADVAGIFGFAWLAIDAARTWLQQRRLNRAFKGARLPEREVVQTIRRYEPPRPTEGSPVADESSESGLLVTALAVAAIVPAYLSNRDATLIVASVVVALATLLIAVQVWTTSVYRVIAGPAWQVGSWLTLISSAIGVATILRLWLRDTPVGPYSELSQSFERHGAATLFEDGGLLFFFLLYEVLALVVCLMNAILTNLILYTRASAARSTLRNEPPGWLASRLGPRATWQLWVLPLTQVVLMIAVNVFVGQGFIEHVLDFEFPVTTN